MTQNRSTAVMQRRHEPHDSLDYFPTPPWATRALCERLAEYKSISDQIVWEPACGEGHMARPLGEYFASVFASDVHDYREAFLGQSEVCDFLCSWDHPEDHIYDWVITNPPFKLAEQFIDTALARARVGVAVFVRTSFLEGKGRYERIFSLNPPTMIVQFSERVPLVKGKLDEKASSATSYCWIVWLKNAGIGTFFKWIAPCRKLLEKPGDYVAGGVDPQLDGQQYEDACRVDDLIREERAEIDRAAKRDADGKNEFELGSG